MADRVRLPGPGVGSLSTRWPPGGGRRLGVGRAGSGRTRWPPATRAGRHPQRPAGRQAGPRPARPKAEGVRSRDAAGARAAAPARSRSSSDAGRPFMAQKETSGCTSTTRAVGALRCWRNLSTSRILWRSAYGLLRDSAAAEAAGELYRGAVVLVLEQCPRWGEEHAVTPGADHASGLLVCGPVAVLWKADRDVDGDHGGVSQGLYPAVRVRRRREPCGSGRTRVPRQATPVGRRPRRLPASPAVAQFSRPTGWASPHARTWPATCGRSMVEAEEVGESGAEGGVRQRQRYLARNRESVGDEADEERGSCGAGSQCVGVLVRGTG